MKLIEKKMVINVNYQDTNEVIACITWEKLKWYTSHCNSIIIIIIIIAFIGTATI